MSSRLRFVSHLLLFVILSACCVSDSFAAPRNPENYPLQVHIFDKHQHRNKRFHTNYGNGRGNVVEGDQINGMEYTFDCIDSFLVSETDEAYPAKWKKPGLSLEILMGVIGSDTKTRTCELKVALKDYVFARVKGKIVHQSMQEYAALQSVKVERQQAMSPEDVDPSHYPIEISVLNINWTDTTSGMHSGTGQGNLRTASGLAAVDFALRCPAKIPTTPEGRYYRGQWIEPNRVLSVLLGSYADPSAGATCEMTTVINPDVYVLKTVGVVKAVSQDEYRRMQNP